MPCIGSTRAAPSRSPWTSARRLASKASAWSPDCSTSWTRWGSRRRKTPRRWSRRASWCSKAWSPRSGSPAPRSWAMCGRAPSPRARGTGRRAAGRTCSPEHGAVGRFVPPWSSIERYSTREEQWPTRGEQIEAIEALSSEQMGMHVEVSIRWQIDPMQAPKIFTEIGNEDQIRGAVLNAIRKGVRDGMVQYSINDISKRTQIANTMEGLVDSALVTRPRAGGGNFRIATVTAFFLRDLQPPPQVVQAINNKIAQEQQIETERHRAEA